MGWYAHHCAFGENETPYTKQGTKWVKMQKNGQISTLYMQEHKKLEISPKALKNGIFIEKWKPKSIMGLSGGGKMYHLPLSS